MPGGPSIDMPQKHYMNKQHKKAMEAPVKDPSDDIRKAGW